ncbi:sodium:solute symporter family protein [Uliginosibacterium sp. 31-12]|uniref:sodium:solute symporter family protein n=1 Tax=Uliginosibacterium sp. 31-12 TaxID=3062781 RepID=UPI0026E3C474|nr:sodium:solute symporter family protein [Uliginosibacterium sp. 31-12]MDO6388301.1 sodium:solute symporter family protein [Uliginosibacterium sp. 31-12]
MNLDINAAVVLAYFAFMIGIGLAFRKMASNSASDYFRGGGKMLWWMVGASAFMTQFSAWTFTGAAGKAYSDGLAAIAVFVGNVIAYAVSWAWFSARMRQIRVDTPTEGVRRRFGPGNEQFFTWVIIPLSVINAGVWLNSLAIFVSAVFKVDIVLTIWGTGLVVLLISLLSGAWGVVASDFVQSLIVAVLSIACAVVGLIAVGGPGEMVANFPGGFVTGPDMNYPLLIVGTFLFFVVKQMQSINNLQESYRFLSAKDSRHARKAALMALGMMLIGSFIWFVPPWVSASLMPDAASLHAVELGAKAADGVYLAFAEKFMPLGTVGLLLAGLFAATMSSMDSALNRNSGIFVRSFFKPILAKKRDVTDAQLLRVGQLVTIVNGILVILMAQFFQSLKHLSLFDLMMQVATLLQSPILVPLFFGVFVRRTPKWAPWATVVVGLCVSWMLVSWLKPALLAEWLGIAFTRREMADLSVMINIAAHLVLTGGFFCLTTLFYKREETPVQRETDAFFADLERPELSDDRPTEADLHQRSKLGRIVTVGGVGMLAMLLIPNPLWGRMTFLLCALAVLAIGFALTRSARIGRHDREADVPIRTVDERMTVQALR